MKKILILFLGLFLVFVYTSSVPTFAVSGDQFLQELGSEAGGVYSNLSNFDGFIIRPDDAGKIKLLDTSITDSYCAYSTRNQIMGACTTEFEYYRIGEGQNNTYNIMVLYKSTVEPKDNVKYANGLGNLFTETGDAAAEYVKLTVNLDTIGSAFYKESEPKSTIITYTTTVSISYQYVTDSQGYLYIMPVTSYSTAASYPSVIVENSSSILDNLVNIKHVYTTNDTYSMNTTEQYGCFYFTIPNSFSSILLRIGIEAEFTIAEGGFWGECRSTTGGTHNKYVIIS